MLDRVRGEIHSVWLSICRIAQFSYVVWMRVSLDRSRAKETSHVAVPDRRVQPARRRSRPAAEMTEIVAAVDVVNQRAIDAGSFVFAGGLHDHSATTTVDHAVASRSSVTVPTWKARNSSEASGYRGAGPRCGSGLRREASVACRECSRSGRSWKARPRACERQQEHASPLRVRVCRRSCRGFAQRGRGAAPQRVAADRGNAGKALSGP